MKKYFKPNLFIEEIEINEMILQSPSLEDGGEGGWDDGSVEEFTF